MSDDVPFIEDEPLPLWRSSHWASAVEGLFFGKTERMAELLERGEYMPLEIGRLLAQAFRGDPNVPFHFKLVANTTGKQKKSGRPSKKVQSFRNQFIENTTLFLEQGHQIPEDLGRNIAESLRANPDYPFRLCLSPTPKLGEKRNGRWPEQSGHRDFFLALQMAKNMKEGMSYDPAAQAVSGIGDQTVKKAYSKHKDMFLENDFVARWDDWVIELTKIKETVYANVEKSPEPSPPIAKWMLGGDSEPVKTYWYAWKVAKKLLCRNWKVRTSL